MGTILSRGKTIIEDIRKLFRVKKEDIIPYSALCDYKLEDIAQKITKFTQCFEGNIG